MTSIDEETQSTENGGDAKTHQDKGPKQLGPYQNRVESR